MATNLKFLDFKHCSLDVSKQSLVLYLIVFLGSAALCKSIDVGKEGFTLTVEHAVGTGSPLEYGRRGEITIKSIKGIVASYKDGDELSSQEFQNQLMAAVDKGNFYHIRISVQPSDSEESKDPFYLSTFIKACSLLKSNFSDIIKLNVDHTGQIFAVGLSTTTADCSGFENSRFHLAVKDGFNTTVVLSHVTPGPVPETQTYIKKMEDERREKERGKGKDNRSFFAKYWMYIVPLVIFVMLSAQEPPAGAGGAGGSGGAGGGGGAN